MMNNISNDTRYASAKTAALLAFFVKRKMRQQLDIDIELAISMRLTQVSQAGGLTHHILIVRCDSASIGYSLPSAV